MSTFVDYINNASEYMGMSVDNVLAVHCRGGKGRSGVLCCAWLLYSGECRTADEAMAKFAVSRTEWRAKVRKRERGAEQEQRSTSRASATSRVTATSRALIESAQAQDVSLNTSEQNTLLTRNTRF